MKRIDAGVILTLLLLSVSTLASNIQPVKANGTIYIRADGSVDPPDAPISNRDDVTYTFTDNINDSIVVERSNIIIDGDGYTLQRNGSGNGFYLYGINHVTIKNTNIKGFYYGIHLNSSSYIVISGNNITANNDDGIQLNKCSSNLISENNITASNEYGICLDYSSNNTINENNITANKDMGIYIRYSSMNTVCGNNITHSYTGIRVAYSSDNKLYHNNLIYNTRHLSRAGIGANSWDNGYPFGGNYWSDYNGIDVHSGRGQNETGSDGIGDSVHVIDASTANIDHFPLMGPVNFFKAGTWDETPCYVHIVSNSTVTGFRFSEDDKRLSFNATGIDLALGFCRVAIPHELMWCDEPAEWNVTVNGNRPIYQKAIENDDHTFLYFTYNCTAYNVKITSIYAIQEFPSFLILPLFMITTLLAVILYRREGLSLTVR